MAKASDYSTAAMRQLLRDSGLRATAARIAVLQRLAEADRPVTHGMLVENLANFGFDQSTVYRALMELSDAEVISRLDLGDQVRRFEYRDRPGQTEFQHAHFMCFSCGDIQCLEGYAFRLQPPAKKRLNLAISEVLLKGQCAKCGK